MSLETIGCRLTICPNRTEAEEIIANDPPKLILLSDQIGEPDVFQTIRDLSRSYPLIPIVFVPARQPPELAAAIDAGISGYIPPSARSSEIQARLRAALERRRQLTAHASEEVRSLQQRITDLETIGRFGRKIVASLDLEGVLTAVVDAAVELSEAEEGNLLLPDETTGELLIFASRNFEEDFVRTFRLPIQDSLAGTVFQTGKPILLDEKSPRKIKTDYLVHTLIYMPITVKGRVIGVLGVDNRQSDKPFGETQVRFLAALANYAAIALENAQLFAHTEAERSKLETILTKSENGVVVVDFDGRLILVNHKAREAFGIHETHLTGKRASDLIQNQDLLEVLRDEDLVSATRIELTLNDGCVMNTQITPIPNLGLVVIMQDITHLKELDRIKTEFVNTVSHDLRSPLTAILGYTELIERVGSLTEQQQEFIRRVQQSVHTITSLINDLLDLGRIESGFDARKEILPFNSILEYAVDNLKTKAAEKSQNLIVDVTSDLPHVLGNPIRLRQLVANLLVNAIKYTQKNGEIYVQASAEAGQIILRIADNGPGIPAADQPHIFDKFYRASNVPEDLAGIGLGLAIAKSIVENHQGRTWVESTPGEGTVFTVVLPSTDLRL
ncbi:MAG: GAF domain-containing protein [Anaerolineae bacterium]|nr:GAF domain-containing protein [Anaerolineae bacterium]